jgi:VanZ family protein
VIATFLVDHSALMPWTMVLVVAVCVGAGYPLLRARRFGPRFLWALAALSMAPVAALTLVPVPGRSWVFCAAQFDLPSFHSVESLANVMLLFPAVYFASLATRRPLLMFAAGAALSAAIEVFQGLVPAIGRSCDTNDWAMNAAGAAVAALVAGATLALADRARRSVAQSRDG